MAYRKYVFLFCFLSLVFGIAGCGKQETTTETLPVMREEVVEEKKAEGQLAMEDVALNMPEMDIDIELVQEEAEEDPEEESLEDIAKEGMQVSLVVEPADDEEEEASPEELDIEIALEAEEIEDIIEEIGVPSAVEAEYVIKEDETLIADFEGWPNNLGGEIGVYGSLEPDWDNVANTPYSWVYEAITPGYNTSNVHSGRQSFRLVNGLGLKPNETWGSFAMDLGPTIDLTVVPKRVESFDASDFKYLTFSVKGAKGGEKMALLIRDSHALNYMPQVKYALPAAGTKWQKVVVPLGQFKGQIDLTSLDNIGLAFGSDVGNMKGAIVYVDNFIFTSNPE